MRTKSAYLRLHTIYVIAHNVTIHVYVYMCTALALCQNIQHPDGCRALLQAS